LTADVGQAIAMATGGALVFAPVEYVLTVWEYPGESSLLAKLRLVALTATLSLWLWFLLVVLGAAALVTLRLVQRRFSPAAATRLARFTPAIAPPAIRPNVAKLWSVLAASLVFIGLVQKIGAVAVADFKEPQLIGFLVAAGALVAGGIAIAVYRGFARVAVLAATALAELEPPRIRPELWRALNPLGRWRAAGVALAVAMLVGFGLVWMMVPACRSYVSWRMLVSCIAIGLGAGFGAYRVSTHRRRPRRGRALALAAGSLALNVVTLLWLGADLETKYMVITASPALDHMIDVVRIANDVDRDGYGTLLGGGDCAPFDGAIHPFAKDLPDNGIDEDCDGRDLTKADLVAPVGPTATVPREFQKPWNILFITVDTVRYDHTTFGGYADGPKHRNTTPNLQKLVDESTSFTFAHAPSAGTMASIPAILTSKYFHSGIALDENVPPGYPPKILPENTIFPEIMKRGGYRTAVVASHEWWNDWGFDQGVDDYDNSIGRTPDPDRVAADQVTDHILAWVSRHANEKWFMWAHYIDPHGHYVAHPDVVDYGGSDPDLYDAEIQWTDQELGRLFRELRKMPNADRTIIVLTSDHGESMAEHAVPLGTHGTALYEELQHIPLIFYIPGNPAHRIGGAVSNLDIIPTISQLCSIDTHDLSFEGRSLVGELFSGKADDARVVFAETNSPTKQRAAIGERYKIIYYLATNVYELFDLQTDPGEKVNLAPKNPPALAQMKGELQAWMNRVLYARDPLFNQAYRQARDVVLDAAPTPEVTTEGQTLASAADILGIGTEAGHTLFPGGHADVHVYFHVRSTIPRVYRFSLAVWPVAAGAKPTDPRGVAFLKTPFRATAEGAMATDHWRAGDYIRERFNVAIPADWQGSGIAVGLIAQDATSQPAPPTGAKPSNDPSIAWLGVLPLAEPGPVGAGSETGSSTDE
jgi:arylsulfatase A-like enzyme